MSCLLNCGDMYELGKSVHSSGPPDPSLHVYHDLTTYGAFSQVVNGHCTKKSYVVPLHPLTSFMFEKKQTIIKQNI